MYYVSRSNEIARYKSDFQSGKQVVSYYNINNNV